MLSVLIPTYNYNAFTLVKEIHKQLSKTGIDFEIICFDDGSKSVINKQNEQINLLTFSRFQILEKNIGRSAIRNLLANKAKYKWLLFFDADMYPASQNFIDNYLCFLDKKSTVVCGGMFYENTQENKNLLRYKFGKKHEEVSVEKRNRKPEKYFFTSNFLIRKEIFKQVKFEEKLKQYGKEDLMFSLSLRQNNIKIQHVANEMFHLGIDNNSVFVSKTKKAMENLLFLKKNQLLTTNQTPLLKVTKVLKTLRLLKICAKMFGFFEKLAIRKSSVFYVNCLKVCYLCYLKQQNKIKM